MVSTLVLFFLQAKLPLAGLNDALLGLCLLYTSATAIKISMHGIQIEITNAAAESTIVQTLTALQKLC